MSGATTATHPDDQYKGFALALHEADHALGLSRFSYDDLVDFAKQLYENTHPTVPDSVLNYDYYIRGFYPPSMAGAGFKENDCAPHPFGILALFALYQNVSR